MHSDPLGEQHQPRLALLSLHQEMGEGDPGFQVFSLVSGAQWKTLEDGHTHTHTRYGAVGRTHVHPYTMGSSGNTCGFQNFTDTPQSKKARLHSAPCLLHPESQAKPDPLPQEPPEALWKWEGGLKSFEH